MYIHCRIKYVDDGEEFDTVISESDGVDEENDENIFFYGLSSAEATLACNNDTVLEGEWTIEEIYSVTEYI